MRANGPPFRQARETVQRDQTTVGYQDAVGVLQAAHSLLHIARSRRVAEVGQKLRDGRRILKLGRANVYAVESASDLDVAGVR